MDRTGNGLRAPSGLQIPDKFLEEFWQKKPCLIRQAFIGFKPLVDGDDLAGLACEEMAESRLVSGSFEKQDWQLRHGPFAADDFSVLPETDWTLLVQDVEKHYAPLQAFMGNFCFIPSWRLDDLMISYAVRGGSVGPHVDQYDVFLLQAEGSRRWQIAKSFDPELLGDCQLNVLRRFSPELEWVLNPGDMLYLPPNIAHHGVALEPGMTWSIGSRAPSGADLLQGLGEWLAYSDNGGGRYSDPGLRPSGRAGEISTEALQGLRELMLGGINDNQRLDFYLAAFMSRFRLAHEPFGPPSEIQTKDVRRALESDKPLYRNPWTRMLWIETVNGARLFAAGQAYECSTSLAESLCEHELAQIDSDTLDPESIEVLTRLINAGHLMFQPG